MRAPLVAALLVLAAGPAGAHVPDVDPSDRTIEEADRSWAFYEELPPGAVHRWTFTLDAGDRIAISIAVPPEASWRPHARLDGPLGPLPLATASGVDLEPFAPFASEARWKYDGSAPASGVYTVTISGPGGRYVLGYGLAERFTVSEWARVPIDTLAVAAWEGDAPAAIALPYVLAAGAVAAVAAVSARRPSIAAGGAAALFLGSALARITQVGGAASSGAVASAGTWTLALALSVPAFALAAAAWRARRPWSHAATALAGVATWAGLLVGPALAVLAAAQATRGSGRVDRRAPLLPEG